MSETIAQREQELVEEFEMFDNWMDRYSYLIDLGRTLPEYPQSERRAEDKVAGCQSQVWFQTEAAGDTMRFRAISDAAIVSGLIAILLRLYNDQSPAAIRDYDAGFVQSLGLDQHLSQSRSNGLLAMLQRIRQSAESGECKQT
ncbi:MAG: SufE family protein [Pseudomonadota bacterium]